jgi:hypothetical protein
MLGARQVGKKTIAAYDRKEVFSYDHRCWR